MVCLASALSCLVGCGVSEGSWKSRQHISCGFGSSTEPAFSLSSFMLRFAGVTLWGPVLILPGQTIAASLGLSLPRDCWLSKSHPSPESPGLLAPSWQPRWLWRTRASFTHWWWLSFPAQAHGGQQTVGGEWHTPLTSISSLLSLGCSPVLAHISCFSFFRLASTVQVPLCTQAWDDSQTPVPSLLKTKWQLIKNV